MQGQNRLLSQESARSSSENNASLDQIRESFCQNFSHYNNQDEAHLGDKKTSDSNRVQFIAKLGVKTRHKRDLEAKRTGGGLDSGLVGGDSGLPKSDKNNLKARCNLPNKDNLHQSSIADAV